MWTILGETVINQRRKYQVQCDCGAIEYRRADHVESGRTKHCKKCSAKETYRKHGTSNPALGKKGAHKGVGAINKTLWNHYHNGAVRRGWAFNITIDYAWDLFVKQGGRCAISGAPIELHAVNRRCNPDWSLITASLDRIDSDRPYEPGNVQWVHKEVNYIKRDLAQGDFIEWCKRIAANNS